MQFFVAYDVADSWVTERGLIPDHYHMWDNYGWAVFRAVSHMFCIGYGIKNPSNCYDAVVCTGSMLGGALCFAIFLGEVTSIVASMNISKSQYNEKMMQVKEYMSFRKFPLDLRRRMDDYYENRFQGKMFNEPSILNELNPVLREELINHNCCELIESVPFFRNADADFLSNMISCLKYEVYLNGDCIIRQGNLGQRMYFISRGTVLIRSSTSQAEAQNVIHTRGRNTCTRASTVISMNRFSETDSKKKDVQMEQRLSDGAYFGEICLLLKGYRRVASVYADSQVNAYALDREDFERVLEFHPEQREMIRRVAQERMDAAQAKEEFGMDLADQVDEWAKMLPEFDE